MRIAKLIFLITLLLAAILSIVVGFIKMMKGDVWQLDIILGLLFLIITDNKQKDW